MSWNLCEGAPRQVAIQHLVAFIDIILGQPVLSIYDPGPWVVGFFQPAGLSVSRSVIREWVDMVIVFRLL